MKHKKEGLGITIAAAGLAIANLAGFVVCFWAWGWRLVVSMEEAKNMFSCQPIWWLATGILWAATAILCYQTYFVIGKKKDKKE